MHLKGWDLQYSIPYFLIIYWTPLLCLNSTLRSNLDMDTVLKNPSSNRFISPEGELCACFHSFSINSAVDERHLSLFFLSHHLYLSLTLNGVISPNQSIREERMRCVCISGGPASTDEAPFALSLRCLIKKTLYILEVVSLRLFV